MQKNVGWNLFKARSAKASTPSLSKRRSFLQAPPIPWCPSGLPLGRGKDPGRDLGQEAGEGVRRLRLGVGWLGVGIGWWKRGILLTLHWVGCQLVKGNKVRGGFEGEGLLPEFCEAGFGWCCFFYIATFFSSSRDEAEAVLTSPTLLCCAVAVDY